MKLSSLHIKKTLVILILCFSVSGLFALKFDVNDLDSLKRVSNKLQGKEKVRCYNCISELYWTVNIDSSIYYANLALVLAEKIQDEAGMAFANNNLGSVYFYQSNFYKAIYHFSISLELRKKLGQKKNVEAVLSNLSSVYMLMGIYDKAIDYNYQSLKISEEINDSDGIATAYFNNAFIYSEQGMADKSISFNFRALEVFKSLNNLMYASSTLNNIGSQYRILGKKREAKYYIYQALAIANKQNNLYSIANIIDNLGGTFADEGQYDSAIFYHQQAITVFNKLQIEDVTVCYINLAKVYLETRKHDSAKYYIDKAYTISTKTNQLARICNVYELYTKYYEDTKNPVKALEYYRLFKKTTDSIQSAKNINILLSKQIDYERDKLKAEKEIQDLKIKRNQNQRNFSIVCTVLVLLLSILLYSRFVLKKRTNRLLLEKNNELQIANQTKDKFFTIISHDLKNQLTAFQNISQVLAENFSQIAEEKKQHLVIRINTAAITLYRVLENLLTWSSSQLQGFEYQPKLFNIKELTDEICSEFDLQSEKKSIRIINQLAEETFVLADENMTRDVLRNLINNSIKYSPDNSEVIISSKVCNKMLEISVIDKGIGISQSDQQKLFRLDVNHKEIGQHKEKGSGLGLIIVKDFVEKMNGNIWVDSKEGFGSSFTFSLPIN